jgi:hypothetical protein
MYIVAYYSLFGAPAVGLAPTATVYDVAAGSVAVIGAMTGIGGGWYRYDYAAADPTRAYVATCDAGDVEVDDRYAFGSTVSPALLDVAVSSRLATAGVPAVATAVRAEMDSNSVKLDVPVSSVVASGDGPANTEYTVTVAGAPCADCLVWIATDQAGQTLVANARTDLLGVASFYLDPGTYYVFRRKSGVNFVNPEQLVVA